MLFISVIKQVSLRSIGWCLWKKNTLSLMNARKRPLCHMRTRKAYINLKMAQNVGTTLTLKERRFKVDSASIQPVQCWFNVFDVKTMLKRRCFNVEKSWIDVETIFYVETTLFQQRRWNDVVSTVCTFWAAYSNNLRKGLRCPLTESNDTHYENTPIKIYWKFHHQKLKVFR